MIKAENDLAEARSKGDHFAKLIEAEKYALKRAKEKLIQLNKESDQERKTLARKSGLFLSERRKAQLNDQLNRHLGAYNTSINRNNQLRKDINQIRRRRLDAINDEQNLEASTQTLEDAVTDLQEYMIKLYQDKKKVQDKLKKKNDEIKHVNINFRKDKQAMENRIQNHPRTSGGSPTKAQLLEKAEEDRKAHEAIQTQRGAVSRLS